MPFPHFNPVLLQIGPLAIRWYALAYIAGILLGWRYGLRLLAATGLWAPLRPPATAVQIDDLILWITLGVIVGGRTGYVLFYGQGQFSGDWLEVFRLWHGGMSFHGGFLGVSLALILFSMANKLSLLSLADLVAPCAPIGLFFGRIANFINGELWGRPTSLPWGIIFPSAPDQSPRHPSQLYEAGLEGLVLFLALRWATHNARWLPRRGAVTGVFLLGYGLSRIALENVRNPDLNMPHFPFGLTMGMMLSAPMVIAGLWLILRARAPATVADGADTRQSQA